MTNEEILEQLNERYSQLLSIRAAMTEILPAVVDYVAGLANFKKAFPELAESYATAKSALEAADEAMAEIKANWVARAIGNEWCAPGEQLVYEDVTYEVIQGHNAQFGWEPDITPALFRRVSDPSVIEDWVQPTGAHDAYAKGVKVRHIGKVWESLIDNNVWEPGAVGTEALWKEVDE